MREESLVLQYRQLQKQEGATLSENSASPLDPSVKRLNEMIEDKTHMDLLLEITKVVEPILTAYLKHYTPFREREDRSTQILQGLGIGAKEDLYAIKTAVIDRYINTSIQKSGLFATFTGGMGAIGGIAVSMMELPVLLKTAVETLEYTCEAYGHDPQNYFEKLYLLMLVPFALIPDTENRQLVYGKMKLIESWMKQEDITMIEREQFYPPQEAAAFCATHIARALVINRLLQAVPLAGPILGASMNFDFVNRLGKQAQRMYKRRYLERRLGLS